MSTFCHINALVLLIAICLNCAIHQQSVAAESDGNTILVEQVKGGAIDRDSIVIENGHIRKIVLEYPNLFTDENLRSICPSESLVDFRGCCHRTNGISREGLARLFASRNLEVLMLYTNLTIDQKLLKQISELSRLKQLVILGAELELEGLKLLKQMKSLKSLSLAGTNLDDSSLAVLRDLPISELDVARTKVTTDGLAILKNHPTIKVILIGQDSTMTKAEEESFAPIRVKRSGYGFWNIKRSTFYKVGRNPNSSANARE